MTVTRRGIERIERVMHVRGFEEKSRRREWAAALAVENEAQGALDLARAEVDAAQERLRAALEKPSVEPRAYVELQGGIEAALEVVDVALVALERSRMDRVAKESVWREARRRTRTLEKLRDRRLEQLREEATRLERKETDEVALARHARAAILRPTEVL
jgi:flagellar export protein FliJ